MWGNQGGYDAGGYDNGGGYVGSQGDNQGGSNQDKKKARSSSILPCTIAQLLKAEQVDDKFVYEGIELNQISMVGLVRLATESATNHMYEVDDMTGPIMEVRMFVDNDESTPDEERIPLIPVNTYVYLCGHLRSFSGRKNVTAFKLRRVTDMNEITSHMLEVVHSHITLSKKNPSSSIGGMSNVIGSSSNQNMFNMGEVDTGLTPGQNKVLHAIKACVEDQGITIEAIATRVGPMSQRDIETAMEFLSSEGFIFSTIDENHFKATDTC